MMRTIGRLVLGVLLVGAGIGHFTNGEEFLAQVPTWMPEPDAVVTISGIVELLLGATLLVAPKKYRPAIGWIVAAFFVVIFPGNISQFVTGTDAFGLDSDAARFIRLAFQPVMVIWALWCTSAWKHWRESRQQATV